LGLDKIRAQSRHANLATLTTYLDDHDRQGTKRTLADLVASTLTYSLERPAPAGPILNPRGLLVLDRLGNLVVISTRGGRASYAAAQPSPAEARTALETYDGFFGKYDLTNAKEL
jgi:hypothetical protein